VKTEIAVVGAGPVGLMLASELRLCGAAVTLYDRLPTPPTESRALGFNRRAAEILDQRGLLTRLGTVRWGPMGHFGGVRFDLDMLEQDHSGVLGLPQPRLEAVLGERLSELGVPLLRGYDLVAMRETTDGVDLDFDGPDGRRTDQADYVVGCDGAGSTVRSLAHIPTRTWPASRGSYSAEVADVHIRPRPIGERLPGGNMVLCTPIGPDTYRIVIHDSGLPANVSTPTFAQVTQAWERLTGEDIQGGRPLWLWACGNGAALADRYEHGRILLAGDAAHEIPPLAAWALSAGIQDAANLGWKLAAVVGGRAPHGLLASYERERRPVGATLVRNAQAATALYLGAAMDPIRSVFGELMSDADTAESVAGHVSGLGIRYDLGPGDDPLLGRRLAPHLEVACADGRSVRVGELLHQGKGLLIGAQMSATTRPWADRVQAVEGTFDGFPGSVLVRPDGYVAWTSPGSALDCADALCRWFGAPVPVAECAAQPRPAVAG